MTPSRCRYLIDSGCAMPAYVPRSSSGMSGCVLGEALDVRLVDDGPMPRRPRPAILPPVEERIDDDALRHEGRAVEIVARRSRARRTDRETRLRSSSMGRRSPSRTDRAAAWPDCTTTPAPAPRVRAPGSRSAAPASRPAGSRASKAPSVRAVRCAFPPPGRRTDTARRARQLRRTRRSWCRSRRRWRREGRGDLAKCA